MDFKMSSQYLIMGLLDSPMLAMLANALDCRGVMP